MDYVNSDYNDYYWGYDQSQATINHNGHYPNDNISPVINSYHCRDSQNHAVNSHIVFNSNDNLSPTVSNDGYFHQSHAFNHHNNYSSGISPNQIHDQNGCYFQDENFNWGDSRFHIGNILRENQNQVFSHNQKTRCESYPKPLYVFVFLCILV